jgi:hypothetical protein
MIVHPLGRYNQIARTEKPSTLRVYLFWSGSTKRVQKELKLCGIFGMLHGLDISSVTVQG